MIIFILITVFGAAADQLTKFLAEQNLMNSESFALIPKVLNFTYVENKGAAFGILSDQRWVFMSVTTLIIVAILVYMIISGRKQPKLFIVALAMIEAGGIGNMIDRIFRGYVIDFVDLKFIKFYVFNLADSLVTVGCALVIISIIAGELKKRKKWENG